MANRPLILIAGGYGVFGRLLAREPLSTTPTALMLGGRNYGRALTAARRLGANDRVTPLPLDLSDPDHLARAAKGCIAVACTAGPFQLLDQGRIVLV